MTSNYYIKYEGMLELFGQNLSKQTEGQTNTFRILAQLKLIKHLMLDDISIFMIHVFVTSNSFTKG